MKINFLILIALLIATASITFLSENILPKKTIEKPAINFDYKTLDNKNNSLKNHEGKTILLHFWASWCAPCLIEFPTLVNLAKNQKDLIVLAVAVNDKKPDIRKFLKKLNQPIPSNLEIAMDPKKEISKNLYGTTKLPETYVISSTFSITEKVVGPQKDWDDRRWNQKIQRLSSE